MPLPPNIVIGITVPGDCAIPVLKLTPQRAEPPLMYPEYPPHLIEEEHVDPVQPESHVQVLGAVQTPLSQPLEQTGVVHLVPDHPELHVHTLG